MADEYNFAISEQLMKDIATSVGMIVIDFTFIEQSLSAIAELTAPAVKDAGRKVCRHEKLNDKIDYTKKTFRAVEALARYRDAVIQNLSDISFAKKVRDAFAHGTMANFDSDKGILTLVKVRAAEDHHQSHDVNVSIEVLAKTCTRTQELARFFQKLAFELDQEPWNQTSTGGGGG